MSDLYSDLGVPKDADEAALKKARNAAARRHHPDNGAEPSVEKFDKAQRAFLVLSDPGRRSEYDRTGSTHTASEAIEESQARGLVTQAITAAAVAEIKDQMGRPQGKVKVATFDVRQQALNVLSEQARNAAQAITNQQDAISRLEEVQRRLTGGDGVLSEIITGQIGFLRQVIPQLEANGRITRRAVEIVSVYGYRVDPEPVGLSGLRQYTHDMGFSLFS